MVLKTKYLVLLSSQTKEEMVSQFEVLKIKCFVLLLSQMGWYGITCHNIDMEQAHVEMASIFNGTIQR